MKIFISSCAYFALSSLLLANDLTLDMNGGNNDVPAAFIYDPLTGNSTPNPSSSRLVEDLTIPAQKGSFTFEVFAKPDSVPGAMLDLISKTRASKSATTLAAGIRFISNAKQSYWAGAVTLPGSVNALRWSTGHYVSISRVQPDTLGWRHLALVYDEEKRTVTVWLDHWQSATQTLDAPLALDDAPFIIDAAFEGLVDSARLTPRALGPEHFLRATQTALSDISFADSDVTLPANAGHLSVRRHFGAVGDGVTDDTAAIQKAFSDLDSHQASSDGTYVLYFPAGKYLVSDTVKWGRFLRVIGESRENTAIFIADQSPKFSDPENPRPVVAASGVKGPPGSNSAVNGSTIANWFHGFTVSTGSGNSGAVGVEFHSNNYGSLEHVRIRSGDGAGVTGLDLSHKTNGPTVIADVNIEGFETGIKTRYMEYSITMEDVTLSGQRTVGIDNRGNILALRHIRSRNSVPVLRSASGSDLVTVLDSEFTGGSPDTAAIESEGALYARNITVEGYGQSIAKSIVTWNPRQKNNAFATSPGQTVTGHIEEFVSDTPHSKGTSNGHSLALPIEEVPTVPIGDLKTDWVNVRDCERLVMANGNDSDWAPAIEAAFATGKPTIYFPRGGYPVSRTVTVPPSVQRLYGMDNGIAKGGMADKHNPDYEAMPAALRFEGDTDAPLLVDFFSLSMIDHASKRPLILRHARFAYRAQPGAGNVFLWDALGPFWSFQPGQKVWARQWNVESHAEGPCIHANGANVWALGFKTEYGSQKLRATNGAAVEILGSFIYPVVKDIPTDRPVFEIIDSRFSAQWGLSVYTASHHLQVRDVKNGTVRETVLKDGQQLGPRFRFDLYSND